MPRRPTQPRYFPSRGGYYVQVDRVQHELAKGDEDDPEVKERAWKAFHALMATRNVLTEGDSSPVWAVLERYLQWVKANQAENTFLQRSKFLQSFVDKHGKVAVKDLRKHHVESWLADHQEYRRDDRRKKWVRWGGTSRRIAITALITALNWAKDQGLTTVNPVAGMKRPPQISRSTEALITDEQHRLLLERADKRRKKGFRHLLVALFETGARPGEITGIEASHYNPKIKAWVISARPASRGKNKLAYQGKMRTVFLTPKLQEIVEALNREYPTGPIFRDQNGNAFRAQTVIKRFLDYRKIINKEYEKKGEPPPFTEHITAYSYRHRFVTDWMLAGKPVGYLADLLGTSINMIQRHYSHLSEKSEALRRELLSFNREGGESSAPKA